MNRRNFIKAAVATVATLLVAPKPVLAPRPLPLPSTFVFGLQIMRDFEAAIIDRRPVFIPMQSQIGEIFWSSDGETWMPIDNTNNLRWTEVDVYDPDLDLHI